MKKIISLKQLTVVSVFLIVSFGSIAQSGGTFEISNSTIDAGGTTSVGGAFELTGSVGQFDAGQALMAGQFELSGGFWVSSNDDLIFENGFE